MASIFVCSGEGPGADDGGAMELHNGPQEIPETYAIQPLDSGARGVLFPGEKRGESPRRIVSCRGSSLWNCTMNHTDFSLQLRRNALSPVLQQTVSSTLCFVHEILSIWRR